MDTDAVERLTKDFYAQKKRKGKAPDESLKWAKVGASDPMASIAIDAALEVRQSDEVIPTTRAIVIEEESLHPKPANLPSKDRVPDPPSGKEKERRKGKAAIMKKSRKVHSDEPNRDSNED